MPFIPAGAVTGIGSLPLTSVPVAIQTVVKFSAEIPFWPQLPRLSERESVIGQGLGIMADLIESRSEGYGYQVKQGRIDSLLEILHRSSGELTPANVAGFGAFEEALATASFRSAVIKIIQIDEPAIREGLPLRRADWLHYLDLSVSAFRLASSGGSDHTQIHTHMCYSEFNDIIGSIVLMDADAISIECSRSRMELLDAFHRVRYPNEIGPGVYDIHSPRVPEQAEIKICCARPWKFLHQNNCGSTRIADLRPEIGQKYDWLLRI